MQEQTRMGKPRMFGRPADTARSIEPVAASSLLIGFAHSISLENPFPSEPHGVSLISVISKHFPRERRGQET
jgi:hypothetical protein